LNLSKALSCSQVHWKIPRAGKGNQSYHLGGVQKVGCQKESVIALHPS